jgi:hypothetical protein
MNKIEEIQKLKSLLDQGAITQEEFDSLKKNIISASVQAKDSIPNGSINIDCKEKILLETPVTTQKIVKKTTGNKTNKTKAASNKRNEKTYSKSNSTEWEAGNEVTTNLVKLSWAISIIIGIIFWVRYDSFIAFIFIAGLSIAASIAIPKLAPKLVHKNMFLGMLCIVMVLLIIFPIGNTSKLSVSGSSDNKVASTESVNDDDKFVRDYIISHRYVDIENGVSFTLKFSDSRGGWFGIMTMEMGSCWSLYQYETKGRSINLKFDSSNCTTQGDSRTATFNSDNSISFNINGQNFVFQPL